jgi:MFS family permease
MSGRTEQIFVGSIIALVGAVSGALATAVVNLWLAGKITMNNWWLWGIGAVLGAILLYSVYETHRFPFKKFRVTTHIPQFQREEREHCSEYGPKREKMRW